MRRLIFAILLCTGTAVAEEATTANSDATNTASEQIRTAIEKAVPWLEKGARGSAEQRTCFTCHNQALPVFALQRAKELGFSIDQEILDAQVKHTWEHLERGKERYAEGFGQGGQGMTAGYALWTLDAVGHEPDEVTAAVTHYLLEYQQAKQRWISTSKRRPPSSGSHFTAHYLALRGLDFFGTNEQSERIEKARQQAGTWLLEHEPEDTEDRVFKLRSLPYVDADQDAIQHEVDELLDAQHKSGGWAQTDEMEPDVYATATVLVALRENGSLESDHPAVASGIEYLLKTQQGDGTWHVVTRADGFQEYFESGFPHGKDQFISIAATGWAVLALAEALAATR